MYVARSAIVLFLILGIIFTISPLVRGDVDQAWAHARPGVIQFMDGVYAGIRNFIAGIGTHDNIDDIAPGGDFEIMITKESGIFL
jgi:hypothetical protein